MIKASLDHGRQRDAQILQINYFRRMTAFDRLGVLGVKKHTVNKKEILAFQAHEMRSIICRPLNIGILIAFRRDESELRKDNLKQQYYLRVAISIVTTAAARSWPSRWGSKALTETSRNFLSQPILVAELRTFSR